MFTGIVKIIGRVSQTIRQGGNLVLEIESSLPSTLGDSIAVSGVCLTVAEVTPRTFLAQAVEETASRTTLNRLRAGDLVNLEPALLATDRLGGHLVTGHIDETAKLLSIRRLTGSTVFEFGISETNRRLVVNKGSIAIDGISLTVAEVKGTRISVAVIPYTIEHTTLKERKLGDEVNVEFDIIGKYVLSAVGNLK